MLILYQAVKYIVPTMLPRIEELNVDREEVFCGLQTIILFLYISCIGVGSLVGVVMVVITLLLISGNITLM